jgi:hypothetical protein
MATKRPLAIYEGEICEFRDDILPLSIIPQISFGSLGGVAILSGHAGEEVVVNSGANGVTYTPRITTFLGLSDTPSVYTGAGGKIVAVKADLSGLEFITAPTGTEGDYIPEDGWVIISDSLTYVSSSSFTVPGNQTALFQKGTKIKLTDSTVKYFYVTSSVYSAPNTTITITGGDDYALSGGAITLPYYSYVENPVGFPDWFNYTPTITGLATTVISSVVIGHSVFCIKGQTVFYKVTATFTIGTAASQSIMVTVPVGINSSCNASGGSASRVIATDLLSGVVILVAISTWMQVRGYDGTSWTTGASKQLRADVYYQMA